MNRSLLSLVAISANSSSAAAVTSRVAPAGAAAVNNNNNTIGRRTTTSTTHATSKTNGQRTMTNADQVTVDRSKQPTEAAELIRRADIVCFDVDSTVITEEGIDELAKYCGKGTEVARLTREAMGGSMTFQEALRRRLDIIRPSQRQIREFVKARPAQLSNGIKEFVHRLRAHNKHVFLITGGFDCLIEPVAIELGIPLCNLYANKLFFTYDGEYAAFDTAQPTSHTGGKGEAIQLIRQQLAEVGAAPQPQVVVMIGDGATDLEASPPADYFIGYGGNIVREEVCQRAGYYVMAFEQLWPAAQA